MSREEIKNNTTLFLIVIIGAVFALVLLSNRGSMESTGYASGTPSWCAVDCGAVPPGHPGSFWQQTGLCRASSTKSCTGKIYCKLYITDANGNTKRVTGRDAEKDIPCPSSPPSSRTALEWQLSQNHEVSSGRVEDQPHGTSSGVHCLDARPCSYVVEQFPDIVGSAPGGFVIREKKITDEHGNIVGAVRIQHRDCGPPTLCAPCAIRPDKEKQDPEETSEFPCTLWREPPRMP